MKKTVALFTIIAFFVCLFSFNVQADSGVKVYFDGKLLSYDDAYPQIINDRTMVPYAKTAEQMGMKVSWDDPTKTMTLIKGDKTVLHKLGTNTISVNTYIYDFDALSQSINGRTLMPIRMLAKAIDAEVVWDGPTRSVYITSQKKPTIVSVEPDKTQVNANDTVTISVMASLDTKAVRLVDNAFSNLSESQASAEFGEYRKFILKYTPTSQTFVATKLTVCAGDGNEFSIENSQSFYLSVKEGLEIKDASTDKDTVKIDSTVNLTVDTNDGVTKVRVTNDFDSNVLEETSFSEYNNERTFLFNKIPIKKDGPITFTIEVGNENGYITTKKQVTVSGTRSAKLDIDSVTVEGGSYDYGKYVKVTVKTTTEAGALKIKDKDGNTVNGSTSYTDSGDVRTYTTEVQITKTGDYEYTAYTYESNGSTVDYGSKTFTIKGYTSAVSSSYGDATIYSVELSNPKAKVGEYVNVKVVTNDKIKYVYIQDSNGEKKTETKYPTTLDDGRLEFTVPSLYIDSFGRYFLYVYTNDSGYGDYASTEFKVEQ